MKNREESLILLRQYVKNDRMIFHCLASEAVMKALAKRLNEDENLWSLAGLLHDLDVEITNADPKTHALESVKILREHGYPEDLIEAIRLHNEDANEDKRCKKFHHALAAGETITGLIMATALVYPEKKLAPVKPSSVAKRMKEKAFAASVKRENIMECEMLGLNIQEFSEISVNAMKEIATDIGL